MPCVSFCAWAGGGTAHLGLPYTWPWASVIRLDPELDMGMQTVHTHQRALALGDAGRVTGSIPVTGPPGSPGHTRVGVSSAA